MLNDKVILITGASSGIGSLLAEQVSDLGAITILTGRNEQRLTLTLEKISGRAAIYVMDVQNLANIESTVDHIVATYGKIDILINNAGYGKFDRIED
ncbi:MAG TPA: SDR family NAD(P)-dependent oxidoreductase, partial [Candidatus Paenibacillus intestinavium]|nr:SDR family NAD(P)-dependent oxidoreductase [Candidatus Paenibacillus intestinavium]